MCYKSILKKKIPLWMQMTDRPAFSLPRMNVSNNLNRGDPHLNSPEKLILPVYLLKTDTIVVLDEPPEIVELELSVSL